MILFLMFMGEMFLFTLYSVIFLNNAMIGNEAFHSLWFGIYIYLMVVGMIFNGYLLEFRDKEKAKVQLRHIIGVVKDNYYLKSKQPSPEGGK